MKNLKEREIRSQTKKIRKGDKVVVTLGKDRGREGVIKKVFKKKSMLLVEGVNKSKKHVKPRGKEQKGGIIEIEKPVSVSKVAIICPSCKKPTRIGFQCDKVGQKKRICRKCNGLIDGGK